jgi:hypothetical protein
MITSFGILKDKIYLIDEDRIWKFLDFYFNAAQVIVAFQGHICNKNGSQVKVVPTSPNM